MINKLCVGLYFMGMAFTYVVFGALALFFSPVILMMWLMTTIEERATDYLKERKHDRIS